MDKCKNVKCKAKHSMCKDGKCYCMKGFERQIDGSCKTLKAVSMSKCSHSSQCKKMHSMCMKGMCHCKPGYFRHSNGFCKARASMTKMCGDKMCDKHAKCHMGKCRCKTGYVERSGSCVKSPASSQGCRNHCGRYDSIRKCSCSHFCLKRGGCCSDFRQHCMHFVRRFFSNTL